jgi:hypothetical protein
MDVSMTHLRQRMQEDLRLRNSSEHSIRHCTHTVPKRIYCTVKTMVPTVAVNEPEVPVTVIE